MEETLTWNFERNPHMLITGRTGTGKTYLLNKMADYLSQVGVVSASFNKNGLAEILFLVQDEFKKRYEYIRKYCDGKSDATYSELGMKPYFVLVDELDPQLLKLEREDLFSYEYLLQIIKNIVLKGRAVGIFLIVVCQGNKTFLEPMEDNFTTRIFLGAVKGNGTIFVDGNTEKFQTELVTEDFFFTDH
ncbi:helicase HerA-like domain-containing protein [Enterococcus thailandicus]|uniref:helicase HerA-like domain-containing protein n=1 Tax=Enterococcus thailandicus TaxID=417368 RepID=UPI0035E2D810